MDGPPEWWAVGQIMTASVVRKGFKMKVTGSKNISEIDYREDLLRVEFSNGRVYYYRGVPESVYDELVAEVQSTSPEASVGKAFNRLVRSAGYDYMEVEA